MKRGSKRGGRPTSGGRSAPGDRLPRAGAEARPEAAASASGIAWPAPASLAFAGAWALLLAFAPPTRNAYWAVNGLRSISHGTALALAVVALAAGASAAVAPRGRILPALLAVAIAWAVAFPLRETFHLLSDTASRCGAIADFANSARHQTLLGWAFELHAQPLDAAFGLMLTAALTRASHSLERAVSCVSFLLALAYFAGAWRVARRLAGDAHAWAPWLALVAWGGLEAFAGYAESAGIALAAAIWWWDAMLAPLDRRRDAIRLALGWLAVVGAHRLGLVLLAPTLVRLFAKPLQGDRPRVRQEARIGVAACAVLVAIAAFLTGGGRLAGDLTELFRAPEPDALVSVPTDLLNLLTLIAPLTVLAVAIGGAASLRRLASDRRAPALLAAIVLLLPTAFPMPVADSGLGIQRDWDLSALLGLAITVAGAVALAHLPAARRRGATIVALPLLVLGAGGWLAVNADSRASDARARALVSGALPLGERHSSAVLFMLGNRAMLLGNMPAAAHLLETSWRLVPSPARGFHAVTAYLQAGDPQSAARLLASIRSRGGLEGGALIDADSLESRIRAASGATPGP